MTKKIGTLIVDDVELERRRLHRLLSSDPEIQILGECASGSDAGAAVAGSGAHCGAKRAARTISGASETHGHTAILSAKISLASWGGLRAAPFFLCLVMVY